MSAEHVSHVPPKSAREIIDTAREKYLRVFCDVYFPQITDLAENDNPDAINLLVFSARTELQTPAPSELTTTDFWLALNTLTPLMVTAE